MQKAFIFILVVMFIGAGWGLLIRSAPQGTPVANSAGDLIRLHILANSDSPVDQELKLVVRDAVISHLEPYLTNASSSENAYQVIVDHEGDIIEVAKQVLVSYGVAYPVSLQIGCFDFPVRTYGTLVVPAGKYQAVRIMLGEAEGKNWWCVLFPPLCFIDAASTTAVQLHMTSPDDSTQDGQTARKVEFRWKLAELWNKSY